MKLSECISKHILAPILLKAVFINKGIVKAVANDDFKLGVYFIFFRIIFLQLFKLQPIVLYYYSWEVYQFG